MKKRDLERALRQRGWRRVEGAKHDKWTNGHDSIAVPRHREINEYTARGILKEVEMVDHRRQL